MRSKNKRIASDPNEAAIARRVVETSPLGTPQAARVAFVDAGRRSAWDSMSGFSQLPILQRVLNTYTMSP